MSLIKTIAACLAGMIFASCSKQGEAPVTTGSSASVTIKPHRTIKSGTEFKFQYYAPGVLTSGATIRRSDGAVHLNFVRPHEVETPELLARQSRVDGIHEVSFDIANQEKFDLFVDGEFVAGYELQVTQQGEREASKAVDADA